MYMNWVGSLRVALIRGRLQINPMLSYRYKTKIQHCIFLQLRLIAFFCCCPDPFSDRQKCSSRALARTTSGWSVRKMDGRGFEQLPDRWPQFCSPGPSGPVHHGGACTTACIPVWCQSQNMWKVGRKTQRPEWLIRSRNNYIEYSDIIGWFMLEGLMYSCH